MLFGDAVKAIKERINLVDLARRYVNLRQLGNRFVAPCPFHQETKPSFSISPDKGLFYCFGCQASGDLIDFYAQINGLNFKETVNQLAEELGITIEQSSNERPTHTPTRRNRTVRQAMLAMHEDATGHFCGCFGKNEEAREYANKRGLSSDIIERFGIGWAERDWHSLEHFFARLGHDPVIACDCGLLAKSGSGNYYDRFRGRLMFPIRNLSNQVIAFGGRIIADEEEAKYINSSDTPIYSKKEHLYGLAQARKGITASGEALLTEGYMDVLTLHQFGFANSVGVLGTALTENQIRRLSGFTAKICLLFDGDRAGRKAALRACEMLLARGLACRVIMLPEGEDIDSLLRGAGPDAFASLRDSAPDGLAFCIKTLREQAPSVAITWARSFLSSMQVPELISPYASQLARQLGIAEQEFRDGIGAQMHQDFQARGHGSLSRQKLCERDTQIMLYAVRYPERLDDLRAIGADLALSNERSIAFWKLLEKHGPDEVVYHMDEKQRDFWLAQRRPDAPPRNNGDFELACLKQSLDKFYAQSQAASLEAALDANACEHDFDADLQYLHAIREAMRNNNEQS